MLLNRAGNWDDFKAALKTFTSISQNIAYADVKGNIGLFCAAGIPIRDRSISFGILPGQNDMYDWKGYVPFDELPYEFNPTIGHVASANNRTVPADYPYHIGTWYSLPSRYERITEMLSAKNILTPEDMIHIQLDQKSKMAEKYLPLFLNALSDYKIANNSEMKALEILKGWNYEMLISSAAPTIFESLYLQLAQCIYADELGALYSGFNGVPSVSRVATDQLIDLGISSWFDNVNTEATEDFNSVVACAFSGTVAELTQQLGADVEKWKWGQIHTFELEHPLAKVNALKRIFKLNRGPFEVGGSFHTVSPFSYSNNKPFSVNHGSSHRHIYDLSDWNKSLTVIPTGISGIPASKHYCDQTDLYISGNYHADYFTRASVEETAEYRMKFIKE
jgi:penicillin amidase